MICPYTILAASALILSKLATTTIFIAISLPPSLCTVGGAAADDGHLDLKIAAQQHKVRLVAFLDPAPVFQPEGLCGVEAGHAERIHQIHPQLLHHVLHSLL